jgi:hypothetical protein
VQTLTVGVHAKRRAGPFLASFVLLRLFAVDRKPNADGRVEHVVAELKSLGGDIHRLLLTAIGAVAHQSLADDIGSHINLVVSIGKGLQVFGDRRSRSIARLKIKSAERNQRHKRQPESRLRRAAVEECHACKRHQTRDQPGLGRAPEVVGGDDS